MRNDLSDITVVLDRSGSMSLCKDDAEGGLNDFIKRQKEGPGSASFTLVQFDNVYEFVHRAVPIAQVPHCPLVPRGSTALLDAVGRAIAETGERLGAMPEADRPGLVVFVIVTDGQENASKEFTLDKVKEMIRHQQDVYKWQFTFLGANQDAFAAGGRMGVAAAGIANYAQAGAAFRASASNVVRMRTASAGGQSVSNYYTEDEQKEMAGDGK
jgi:hypothetical protein